MYILYFEIEKICVNDKKGLNLYAQFRLTHKTQMLTSIKTLNTGHEILWIKYFDDENKESEYFNIHISMKITFVRHSADIYYNRLQIKKNEPNRMTVWERRCTVWFVH